MNFTFMHFKLGFLPDPSSKLRADKKIAFRIQ